MKGFPWKALFRIVVRSKIGKMSEFDIISDHSQQNLKEVPGRILQMFNVRMLYLQGNEIEVLPEDFFPKLIHLTWLDLRDNKLQSIPENIAGHQYLENLLLSRNCIKKLPNELGLVPKLKVLQVANNPIEYPNPTVILCGTKAVLTFLKEQFEASNETTSEETEAEATTNESEEDDEEKELEEENKDSFDSRTYPSRVESSLQIKGLSRKPQNDRIIHTISKDVTKIRLQSCYNSAKYVKVIGTQTSNSVLAHNALRQDWMEKLKILLEEQQRILQQEKNLDTLSTWRNQKKREPERYVHELSHPPYGTDPEYEKMLCREDLSKEVSKFVKRSKNPLRKDSVEILISDLVTQLKDMEVTYKNKSQHPRSEIDSAGKQIQMIMDIHKKILKLQSSN